jgi:hypothetical protein
MGVKNYYAKSKSITFSRGVASVDKNCNVVVRVEKLECGAYKVDLVFKKHVQDLVLHFFGFKVDGVLQLSGLNIEDSNNNHSVAQLFEDDHKQKLVVQFADGSGDVIVATLGKRFNSHV